ncbi:universal stress protein [Salinimicrobium xinjiangense]|uniref:universal stress protein n=1 Tax=Salinimicrobium xinjiangense TaxID=438596 RepID=UPI00040A5487|nr:universal stress protein [Salinimicrobium xinjiangense]
MRKIIIPTDFSENAFNALKYASELFKYEKSELYILHAYADEVFNTEATITREFLEEYKESVKKKADRELEKLKSRILDLFPNPKHKYYTISAFGLLIDEVNDLAEKENADLIVTSTRGLTNDRKLTFGSNTLQIIKYVQCPVLSIPENYDFSDPHRILFPTNYLLPYQRRELKLVGGIARSFCAEVHMLYVSKSPKETFRQKDNKDAILDQLYEIKVEFHHEELLEKTEAMEKMISELDIDLLILVNSRHSYLENLLYKSTIDKIGLHPPIPFLVLQNFHRS